MFVFKNNTFHVTRGDIGLITVTVKSDLVKDLSGSDITFGVYRKNELDSDPVIWAQDSFAENSNSVTLNIYANPDDIENPDGNREEYWYEIKIGPANTVLGCDETGPKLFYIYPSGKPVIPI